MSALKEKERKGWKWFTTTDMEDPALLSFRQPLTYVSYSQTSHTLSDVFGNYRVFLLVPQCMKNLVYYRVADVMERKGSAVQNI